MYRDIIQKAISKTRKYINVIFLVALLLVCVVAFFACTNKTEKSKIIALSPIGDVMLTDSVADLPSIEAVFDDGTKEILSYTKFWFSAEHVFVQNGKILHKDDAPLEFSDMLTVSLRDNVNIKQTITVGKPYIPLALVSIEADKDYCITGESLPLKISFMPQNASDKNITIVTNCEGAEVIDGSLILHDSVPSGQTITLTAKIGTIAFGTKDITVRKRVEISTVAQLAAIAQDPLGDFVLTADINDFSDTEGLFPIPNFNGTLRGNGHTVSNLSLSLPNNSYAGEQNIGLFGILSGDVFDLTLTNFNINCGKYQGGAFVNAGTLAGKATSGKVSDVNVNGSVLSS
ncbi:MAG: hypothetical protein LBE09_07450, partial [Christensenellaceae bacterium]|nr:hypothetical protein [Christensenellaceae bacterium]